MAYLTADQYRALAETLRATFSSPELVETALAVLPEVLRLTEHLVTGQAELDRLAEVLHPILMALPNYTGPGADNSADMYDLAPLALAAARARTLTDLLRWFLPGREKALMSGLLARRQGASEPFGIPGVYYRTELQAAAPEHARRLLAELGVSALPAEADKAFSTSIAGVRVWVSIRPADGHWQVVLELHDATSPYDLTRQAFKQARLVNRALLQLAQRNPSE